jgi:hypothetical protein
VQESKRTAIRQEGNTLAFAFAAGNFLDRGPDDSFQIVHLSPLPHKITRPVTLSTREMKYFLPEYFQQDYYGISLFRHWEVLPSRPSKILVREFQPTPFGI